MRGGDQIVLLGPYTLKQAFDKEGEDATRQWQSKKDLLLKAEKRAEIVKERLIKKGFPANKLNIIAYDKSSKCKVTLINLEW